MNATDVSFLKEMQKTIHETTKSLGEQYQYCVSTSLLYAENNPARGARHLARAGKLGDIITAICSSCRESINKGMPILEVLPVDFFPVVEPSDVPISMLTVIALATLSEAEKIGTISWRTPNPPRWETTPTG